MSEVSISIGDLTIESRKWPLRIDSEVSVGFKASQAGVHLAQSSVVPSVGFLNQDHWIRRIQYLQILFRVTLASALPPNKSCETGLAEALEQSIITAKLWEQLGLELLHNQTTLGKCADTRGFQLLISLRELRRHDQDGRTDGSQSVDGARLNLQAPLSIPSHQLTSVCYKISFSPLVRNTVTLCKRTERREEDGQLATCIQLVDSVLRSSIAYKPIKMFGVKIGARHQPHSLSMIAPSTFIPGYANLLAGRAKLIEPIVKFLSAFRNREYLNPSFIENDNLRVENEAVRRFSNDKIVADLWVTMANALKNDYHARRLKPLKSSFEVLEPPDQDFEELYHLRGTENPDTVEDAMMLEDDLTNDEQLLFDMFEMYSINDSSTIPRLIEHADDSRQRVLLDSTLASTIEDSPIEEMISIHDELWCLSELSGAERCRSEAGSSQYTVQLIDAVDAECLEQDTIDLESPFRDNPLSLHTNQTRSDEDMLDVWPGWKKDRVDELDADGTNYRDTGQIVDTGSGEEEMFLDTWKDSLEALDMLL